MKRKNKKEGVKKEKTKEVSSQSQELPQSQRFPWAMLMVFGSILLIGLVSILLINALKDDSRIIQIETKEGFYFKARNLDRDFVEDLARKGLESYKIEVEHRHTVDLLRIQNQFIIDTMKIRLEQQRKEVKAAEAAARSAAVRAAEARDAVRALPSPTPTSAAPAPAPEPIPTADEEYSFTWLNSRGEPCEIWIDGVLPRKTLKPGESVHIRANTPLTAWARGVKTQQIWKCKITKEKIEKSKEKILEIY